MRSKRNSSGFTDIDLCRFLPYHSAPVQLQSGIHLLDTVPLPEAVDVLFPLLTVENVEARRRNAELLAILLGDVILERFASPSPRTDLWQDAPVWLHPALSGLDRLTQHIARALLNRNQDPSSFNRLCNALGSQPGLITALSAVVTSGHAQELDKFLSLFEPYGSPRQIALAPTYYCSEECPYCYSQSLASHFPHAMPIESLRRVIEWVKRNDVGLLLLTGGEPTEYPQLNALFELLRREQLRTYMATNNLFDTRPLDALDRDIIDRVSVHVWRQNRYSPELWDRFKRNLDMWCRKGVSVSLRYNLIDHRYYPSEVFDLCARFDIRQVSVGLAFPTPNGVYVSEKDFERFAPLLVCLTQECQDRGLSIRLAKPLPWCAFSEEQVSLLKRAGMFSAVCSIHHHRGTQNIMINPDRSTFACQALPIPGKNLLSFRTADDLADEYEDKVSAALLRPLYDKCSDCYYYVQRACQGACLAYKRMPAILFLDEENRTRSTPTQKIDEIANIESP
ncbi:MAG: radical SAM protein [Anaerolineae bacterium]